MTHQTAVEPTTIRLRGSLPGPDCPLPTFGSLRALPTIEVGEGADAAMRRRLSTGRLPHPLPYPRQSDYDRADRPVELPAVVLSNDVLSATVLPTLGGRVWSLFDHRRGRELLYVNPVLRFANLGLTDAWFAGGIEWNLGTTGHTTLTSRPLHAARIETPTGAGLRLWEWERTRDLVLQIDLALQEDRLLASTRVLNPDPEPKPLYYWTNVAVPETPGTRVVAPADHAWRTDYEGRLTRVEVPFPAEDAPDLSFPQRAPHAVDYFFVCEPPGRFVAALEDDGRGFAQTATDELQGRKLFCWGSSPAGRRWQDWLSGPGSRYTEIQAGWCTTQLEHDVIGGSAEVSWTEAFGGVDVAPAAVAGDFAEATGEVRREIHRFTPPAELAGWHGRWHAEVADAPPAEQLWTASGWGAVECLLRGDDVTLPRQALPFPEVDDASTTARALLVDDHQLMRETAHRLAVPPISPRWQARLTDPRWDDEPWARYARAVGAQSRGETGLAEQEYAACVDQGGEIVGAHRGLGLLADARDDLTATIAHYEAAVKAAPGLRTLITEYAELLLRRDCAAEALAVLGRAPRTVRRHGRARLLEATAHVQLGDHAAAAAVLADLEVEDLAEGSLAVERLWRAVHPGEPVPPRLDFRMAPASAAVQGG